MTKHRLRRNMLASLLVAGGPFAATYAHAQTTIRIPADKPDIQAGINAASNGDTVLVAPGTYSENLNFEGKAITVVSSGGAAQTIIDGGGGGPVVEFVTNEVRASVLNGFTLQNGGFSGGITLPDPGLISAGVLIHNSAPTLINNIIQLNGCYNIAVEQASPLIQNNEIRQSRPYYGASCSEVAIGAGILVDGALGETPEYPGTLGPGPFTPALFPTIIGNTIENNSDIEDVSDSGGGGIHVLYGYTFIQNNIIRNNFSQQGGGGINVSHANYSYYDTVIIEQNLIYGNTSPCGGSGVSLAQSTVAGIGKPFYYLLNNTIVDNIVTGTCADNLHANGSQVYLWQDSDRFVFVNNIIAGSSATQAALYCETLRQQSAGYHLAIFDHNDVFNASGAAIAGQCTDGTGTYGNLSADPLFVNRAGSDYHLAAGSPALDAGNNSLPFQLTTDYDGKARLQDSTAAGYPIMDMGAYEFAGIKDAQVTTVLLTPSAYQVALGGALTLTAALASPNGVPVGTVGFYQDGSLLGYSPIGASGISVFSVPTISLGAHAYTAIFTPAQSPYTPAVSVKTFVVIGNTSSTVTLTSSLSPANAGQTVTLTVTSQSSDGTFPGPITLSDGSTYLATLVTFNGSATYTTSTLSPGSHLLSATFAGDSGHPSATGTLTQVIVGAPVPAVSTTAVVSSLNPSNTGQAVTFTATVSAPAAAGAATGSVSFSDGNTLLGTSALVANAPCSNCAYASSTASISISTLYAGTHTISATYVPTGAFTASSGSVTQTVIAVNVPDTLTVSCPVNPVLPYSTVTLGAQDVATSGTPAGSVAFTANGLPYASLLLTSGSGTVSGKGFAAGSYQVVGSYTSTNGYAAANATCAFAVVTGVTTTTASASPATTTLGQALTVNVTVSSPSGPLLTGDYVTFTSSSSGARVLGTATLDAGGKAAYTLNVLPTGAQTLTVSFPGDASFAASTSSVGVTVLAAPSTTTLTATPSHTTAFATVTLAAHVAATNGTPQGSVLFYANGLAVGSGTLDANGNASLSPANLPTGTLTLLAAYQGNSDYVSSTSLPLSEIIDPAPTAVQLSITPLPQYQSLPVTLSAQVLSAGISAVPSGNFQFVDLTSGTPLVLASAAVGGNGTASVSIPSLTVGTHVLAALYAPTSGAFFASSQSQQQNLVILPSDYALSLSSNSLQVESEYHTAIGITINSIGRFAGSVALSCANLPESATCTFAQDRVNLQASSSATTSVIIDTDAVLRFKSSTVAAPTFGSRTLPLAAFLPAALLLLLRRRKFPRFPSVLATLVLSAAVLNTMGCSGKYPDHTLPGTYDVTIQATAGGQSHTANLTLTVTP